MSSSFIPSSSFDRSTNFSILPLTGGNNRINEEEPEIWQSNMNFFK